MMRITEPGFYTTREGRTAQIIRLVNGKAHGTVPKVFERTWWYTHNGEHAICPSEDLVKRVDANPD